MSVPAGPRGPDRTAGKPSDPAAAARRTLELLFAGLAILAAVSLALNLTSAGREHEDLARAEANAIFTYALAARHWNAEQGGVYAPVSPWLAPNPHLDDPLRDVVTTDGQHLTKVNPAYMTRLIGRELGDGSVQVTLTSLRPLRPENEPDDWERSALEAFARGATEVAAVVPGDDGPLMRYMKPLPVEESCLACHAAQGYRLGEIRGGLGVSVDYRPHAAAHRRQVARIVGGHLLLIAVALAFFLVVGRRLLAGIRAREEALGRVRRLEGLLPLCASCKRVRIEGGDPWVQESWEPLEGYLERTSEQSITHGMCPACAKEYFGELRREPPADGGPG